MIGTENTTTTATTLPATVEQFPTFYAARPDWLDSDTERAQFQACYPELVAQYADCWQAEQETAQA
jgi:hypothetical protein